HRKSPRYRAPRRRSPRALPGSGARRRRSRRVAAAPVTRGGISMANGGAACWHHARDPDGPTHRRCRRDAGRSHRAPRSGMERRPTTDASGARGDGRGGLTRSRAGGGSALVVRVSRLACVRVPWFAAAAIVRCEPTLAERPLVVVQGTPPATRVVEANAAARERSVAAGMTEAHARALCPKLVRRPFVEARLASAQHALLTAALGVSPRVEDAGPGIADLGALAALPRDALATRLGPDGLRAHDLASGVDSAPFHPWTPPPFWEEAQGLDWEVHDLLALGAVLEVVLARLAARLSAVHLAADVIDVRLGLVSGAHHERTVALAHPTR